MMEALTFDLDQNSLIVSAGARRLRLGVQWSFAKTTDSPSDFVVTDADLTHWSEPAGAPIAPETREWLLDAIAMRFATAPSADILARDGALLRGVSKWIFYLHGPPAPSRYYERDRYLAIPMRQVARGSRPEMVLNLEGLTAWTTPPLPLAPDKLVAIMSRIRRAAPHAGVVGLETAVAPAKARWHRFRRLWR